ncbi:MAG: 2OG-Fe(II) oxygenase [Flavobacteriales bacterium]|nr:2OG-Fe(II) oxygenase [Flavobacteriales bacterium]
MNIAPGDLLSIESQLERRSWAFVDGVLSKGALDALRAEAFVDFRAGAFAPARIGKGIEKQRIQELRSDCVRWLDRSGATQAQLAYWQLMDQLRERLRVFFRVHLERAELHFAVYPKGSFYAPHVDQFRAQGDRIFSVITYLNPDWKPGDGGELRIHHLDSSFEDLSPLHGRLVCFRSDEILHEVLPALEQRVSVTGWIRRDAFIL